MLSLGSGERSAPGEHPVPARPPEGHWMPPSGGSERSELGGPCISAIDGKFLRECAHRSLRVLDRRCVAGGIEHVGDQVR